METRLVVLICVLLLVISTTTVLGQDNAIRIPSQVQVQNLNINLASIAEVSGTAKFIEEVEDINLGQTPYPGYSRVIYREDVLYALRQKNIDLQQVDFKIPYQFTVRADYRKLPVEELTKFGEQYIADKLSFTAEKTEIEVLNPPEELLVPQGEISFAVTRNHSRRLLGVTMLPIEVKVNGQTYRKFHVKFKAQVEVEVLLANQNLERGQKISKDLFTKEKKMITNQNQDYVTSLDKLDGKVLKRNLRSGRALTQNLLENEELVKRWQEVKATAQVSGVRVAITAKALENGSKGDIIKIKNPDSGETMKARVIAPNRVEVVIN